MHVHDSVVIGAGQAGLSASFHLTRLGIDHVLLDADRHAGGAWQHRWDSLTMDDVHGVADLPDSPAPGRGDARANTVIAAWFAAYERDKGLPVIRPVRVDAVRSDGDLLVVEAGERRWTTRTVINATGTWTRPFIPFYPGIEEFAGEQLHTATYPGRDHFRGRRVLVVGGGASAVQFLGELRPVTDTLWVTRREPVWSQGGEFDGRAAIRKVLERVREGRPPASVVSVTGLRLRPQEERAAALGAYQRLPMFDRIEAHGVRWHEPERFEPVDTILWATGFRPAVAHLAPLHLTSEHGGIRLLAGGEDVQSATTAAADPRVQLVGYGPSASTIGGNRAGRAAARAVGRQLGRE
ncbi:NAD(P)-binding domain-containing protein [Nocardioides caeni]|uniref:NAD(P)/FAD-dependent oxidoreductase n=1 Tax=Nocardioides caeni TaxID=574700 RepID=A0A4S8NDM9_9ACTN|nr:NAD(P)-binding domain-containing protein [Nocardioides caeni]THV14568.1 NAD(P)/FAD-dependent oxidoreductase [Nocardioides caeni]